MIGVFCKASERETVQEFFELFKTPWEFSIPGRHYQAVISTLYQAPKVNAELLLVFSSAPTEFDSLSGVRVSTATAGGLLYCNGTRLPIYGRMASLSGQGKPLINDQTHSGVVGIEFCDAAKGILRIGYDLFDEVAFLLSEGQPVENALIPTLELHISLLQGWIVSTGIPLVEIPPVPWGYQSIACLTHDVDFVGIRQHKFDHTFWGFVYRALVGSLKGFWGGRIPLARMLKNWKAVLSLPFIYLGLATDFWDQFEQYAEIDKDFSSTFFLIPFKDKAGTKVKSASPHRRAVRYDISDVQEHVEMLTQKGYEIGLHGIDAWHCMKDGKQELHRVREATGQTEIGVRMHWLCFDRQSFAMLAQAGFCYDSSFGYNETIGFKGGTTQVFRPAGVTGLLELPLHIQDTALFLSGRMGLTERKAWDRCLTVLDTMSQHGGVLTLLWHMRSLASERLWGEFYIRLQKELQKRGAWLGSAGQVVRWFRQRRSVVFEKYSMSENTLHLCLNHDNLVSEACLFLRVHRPRKAGAAGGRAEPDYFDVPWNGESSVEISLS